MLHTIPLLMSKSKAFPCINLESVIWAIVMVSEVFHKSIWNSSRLRLHIPTDLFSFDNTIIGIELQMHSSIQTSHSLMVLDSRICQCLSWKWMDNLVLWDRDFKKFTDFQMKILFLAFVLNVQLSCFILFFWCSHCEANECWRLLT